MKILVLNADYQPLNITSFQKGFKLVYKGKAEIVVSDKENELKLIAETMAKPKVIRLLKFIYLPYRRLNLNKQNIFKRDGHRCVYCGKDNDLTLDHVLPKSRGGENSWENLVTCCSKCNGKKDNRTPDEAGMKMRVKPAVPSLSTVLGFDKYELEEMIAEEYSTKTWV